MIAAHRSIPYKIVGAPESPFSLAKKEKQATLALETVPRERASSTSSSQSVQESLTGKSDETCSTHSDMQHQPDTDAQMGDQAVAVTSTHSESQVTLWPNTLGDFPTDPANFRDTRITAEKRAEIVRHGPCQPTNILFSKNIDGRCFQPSWYKRNKSLREWLIYSPKEQKMFCFCCWLFPCISEKDLEKNWSQIGVTNFKKGIEKIRAHEDTRLHCISLAQWKSFQQRFLHGQTIDAEFQRQLETDREKTLLILDRIFSVTLFLALQEISFRGHQFESQAQMSSFENSGNYLELLQLVSKYDPVLAAHLSSKKSVGKYTSPQIQNEIISSISTVIQNQIVSEIQEAKFFCIILDTTPDISHTDQLAFAIRYVKNGKPLERFLCFDEMKGSKAVDFREKLIELLKKYGLDSKLIRGQAMDGCSTMSGIRGGLQTLVREISPTALYVHCMAHRLNLVLVKAATNSVRVKSFFGVLESFCSFFVASPKRMVQLHKAQDNAGKNHETPKALSDTRWAARANAVQHTRDNFGIYVEALEELIENNQLDAHGLADAQGLLDKLGKFEFFVMLLFWFDVLVITKAATDKVQGPLLNIGLSCHLIQACISQLTAMRCEDGHFDTIIAKAKERCESLGIPATFEQRRISRRKTVRDAMATDDPIVDQIQRFKVEIYYSVLDIIINDLKARFSDTTVGIINALKCLSPATLIDNTEKFPAKSRLEQLNVLSEFYRKDLGSKEMVLKEYENIHALLNAWEFSDGEAAPRDHEDLLLFLIKNCLLDQFESIATLLKLSLFACVICTR